MNNKISIYVLIAVIIISGALYFIKPSEVQKESGGQTSVDQAETLTKEQTQNSQTEKSPINTTPVVNTETEPAPTTEIVEAKTYKVSIVNFAFNPKSLIINKGDTVVWTNNDSAPHDVVGNNLSGLKSPVMSRGGTFSFTFNTAGAFDYICSIHPSMKAQIIVK